MNDIYILGIHDGHNASVCLLKNNSIISLESEERFNGVKNYTGFPEKAVEWVLATNHISISDLDNISFPHCIEPVGFDGRGSDIRHRIVNFLAPFIPNKILRSDVIYQAYLSVFGRARRHQVECYIQRFGFKKNSVELIEHHTAHAYSAIHTSGFLELGGDILSFTLDYSGDGLSGSVGLYSDGKYTLQESMKSVDSLGYFYACAAEVLNMKPGHDEYKVMGLAPYVSEARHDYILEKFEGLFEVCNGRIINNYGYGDSGKDKIAKALSDLRFDEVAFGFQYKFEEYVTEFVNYWVEKLNISVAVFGGGSFMNVKANMLLAQSSLLTHVYFMPSSGDESTSIGAVYKSAEKYNIKGKKLQSLCLGRSFGDDEILSVLDGYDGIVFEKSKDVLYETAVLLAEGNLIGRFSGRSEWGARALGNRSIICRADDLKNVYRINKAIKVRDFWMPFAPAILDKYKDKYLIDSGLGLHELMTVSYPVTELAMNDIPAAVHLYDKTARPMIVTKDNNYELYQILENFEELTKMGGVLNTSFNLHRRPIVNDPSDALDTYLKSDLDVLIINNYIVRRANCKTLIEIA